MARDHVGYEAHEAIEHIKDEARRTREQVGHIIEQTQILAIWKFLPSMDTKIKENFENATNLVIHNNHH